MYKALVFNFIYKNKGIIILFFLYFIGFSTARAQPDFFKKKKYFTAADTLRGMLRPERTCYDVTYYDLNLKVDIAKKYISGKNDIYFDVKEDFSTLQFDLFDNLTISYVLFEGEQFDYKREFNAIFVTLPSQKKGSSGVLSVFYEGYPTIAQNAPWDGGFTFRKDADGKDWVATSCEGIGASLWYPCKDYLGDEPDSMAIRVSVPTGLQAICNGNLRATEPSYDGYTRFDWAVTYPINNYNVALNIGNYTHFSDIYTAADGEKLALDYYVMPYNLEKARKHFEQVKPMLACYERFFGKYPFWRDGYALVETPHLGMEHQSAIAYGNQYQRGYMGGRMPEDMNWDFIIVHESGHEYFGNALSVRDHAEMWLHESFTTYAEALYTECTLGYEAALRYLLYQRKFVRNKEPLLGPMDVNFTDWSDTDTYYKGSWVLHTLRNAIGDDPLWFDVLKSFYQNHAIGTVTTSDFTEYIKLRTKKNYDAFFEQYLRYPNLPVIELKYEQCADNLQISYRWKADVADFAMPIKMGKKGQYKTVNPVTNKWQKINFKNLRATDFSVATELFLVKEKGQP